MSNEEHNKQQNIKIIIELLNYASAEKVSEILVFIKNYISQ